MKDELSRLTNKRIANNICLFLEKNNGLSQKCAKVILSLPPDVVFPTINLYSHIVLNDFSQAFKELEKLTVAKNNIYIFFRVSSKDYDISDEIFDQIKKHIETVEENYLVEQALCNFSLRSTKRHNELFSDLIKRYIYFVQKNQIKDPISLLANISRIAKYKNRGDIHSLLIALQKYYVDNKIQISNIEAHFRILEISQAFHNIIPEYKNKLQGYIQHQLRNQAVPRNKQSIIWKICQIITSGYSLKNERFLFYLLNKRIKNQNIIWNTIFYLPQSDMRERIFERALNITFQRGEKMPEALLQYFKKVYPSQKLDKIESFKNFRRSENQFSQFLEKVAEKYEVSFEKEKKLGLILLKINDVFLGITQENLNPHNKEKWVGLFKSLFDKPDDEIQLISLVRFRNDSIAFICQKVPALSEKTEEMKTLFLQIQNNKSQDPSSQSDSDSLDEPDSAEDEQEKDKP